MGLDMYLTRKVYVGAEYKHRNVTGEISIRVNGEPLPVNFKKVSYIEERAGYWRKANQIHKWFVDNVQNGEDDCREYSVEREQLADLLDRCLRVLEASELVDGKIRNGQSLKNGKWIDNVGFGKVIKDPSVAHELLPVQSGFFFGGTDYDEYYLQDIQETVDILKPILSDEDDQSEYYYQSSW